MLFGVKANVGSNPTVTATQKGPGSFEFKGTGAFYLPSPLGNQDTRAAFSGRRPPALEDPLVYPVVLPLAGYPQVGAGGAVRLETVLFQHPLGRGVVHQGCGL